MERTVLLQRQQQPVTPSCVDHERHMQWLLDCLKCGTVRTAMIIEESDAATFVFRALRLAVAATLWQHRFQSFEKVKNGQAFRWGKNIYSYSEYFLCSRLRVPQGTPKNCFAQTLRRRSDGAGSLFTPE